MPRGSGAITPVPWCREAEAPWVELGPVDLLVAIEVFAVIFGDEAEYDAVDLDLERADGESFAVL